jgi:hypothetical protein
MAKPADHRSQPDHSNRAFVLDDRQVVEAAPHHQARCFLYGNIG